MLLSYLFPSGTSVIDLHSPGRLNQREVLNLSGSSEHSHFNSGRRIIYRNSREKRKSRAGIASPIQSPISAPESRFS